MEVHILIEEIRQARKDCGWSQRFLAERIGCSAQVIKRLEAGIGSVETLVAVMDALEFRLTGVGPGMTLANQLREKRRKRGWSVAATATKTGLSPSTILNLERGGGSVASLVRLLGKLAPTARRRAPERAYWGEGDKADRDSRFTPPKFLEAIHEAFGEIDLDPCGHILSPVKAKRCFLLSEGDNGLTDKWSGRFAFVNPPFSQQQKWLRRAHEQWTAGHIETVVCLVPTRTDSEWFQEVLSKVAKVYLLKGRLRFADPRGQEQATPFSVMLVILGSTAPQRIRLQESVSGLWMI
ncbi:DNA N-6-adenine-methyltransferase [Qipengyuania sp. YIM B01966]|uniref:DNA N-6-adenine-methyltransferase n=1 Tax=Qipengyuania sp. YIM B01966 TaxID=2778646 RepID=UPI000DB4E438|nr:DNA N-6-adenine-methyltransferase [Qipengyuania sp. YIM B01966]PZU13694.1 MAG: hypothetical protein DI591_12935 [Citromicrobium sp.]